jgi:hypothetical protein
MPANPAKLPDLLRVSRLSNDGAASSWAA